MADKNDNNSSFKLKVSNLNLADEIQHQIDDQIRMREGAMKLMSVCGTLNQALETSKNLLTINARILGLMSALQKKKKQHVLQEYNRQRSSVCSESAVDSCTGKVAISDIRVPLMWKDNVHFTGKTGDQSYYAFALIRCGDKVRDTQLYEITSADTDMYFDQTLIFDDLPPDFKMDLEVYYTVITSNEAHGIRTPIRTSMNLRTTKKSIQFKAPKFCLAGHVQLTVNDIKRGMISRDLVMGGKGASGVAVLGDIQEFPIHPLELWGQICCTLAAQPKCMLEKVVNGSCKVMVEESWKGYFCIIYQSAISCWIDETQSKISHPAYVMSYTDVKKVSQTDDGLQINLISSSGSILHSLKFEQPDMCIKWVFLLRGAVVNFQSWKHACTELMHIEATKKHRLSIPTTASFYEQISIEHDTNGVSKRNGNILTPLLDNIDENSEKQIGAKTQQPEKVCADTSNTSIPSNSKSDSKLNPEKDEEEEVPTTHQLSNTEHSTSDHTNKQADENDHLEEVSVIAELDDVISNECEEMVKTNDEEIESQVENGKTEITKEPDVEEEPSVADINSQSDHDIEPGDDNGVPRSNEKNENDHVNDERIPENQKTENGIDDSIVKADSPVPDCKTSVSELEDTDQNPITSTDASGVEYGNNKEVIELEQADETVSIGNDVTTDENIQAEEVSANNNVQPDDFSENVEQEKPVYSSDHQTCDSKAENDSDIKSEKDSCEKTDVEKTSDIQNAGNDPPTEDVADSIQEDVNMSGSDGNFTSKNASAEDVNASGIDKTDENFTNDNASGEDVNAPGSDQTDGNFKNDNASDTCSPSNETSDVTVVTESKNENHTESSEKNEKNNIKKILVKQESLSKMQTTV